MKLGKLNEIDVRKVWEHEQYDFSKWLATEENMKLLSETLNLQLTNIETEKFVGGYRCDILCKDQITEKNVLIENQLEATNHDHLGKIITYASGLDASVVVWIVAEAREEHASAIEWLNKHMPEVSFFLIEIHAYKIGNSEPAPQFKIIEQPNDFAKQMKSLAENNELTDAETCRVEFWNRLNEIIIQRGKPFNTRKATTNHWYSVAVGSSDAHISIDLINQKNKIRVCLWIPHNKELFDRLYIKKEEIEKAVSFKLEWDKKEEYNACSISTDIEGLDFDNKENYDDLINKIIDYVVQFRKALSPHL